MLQAISYEKGKKKAQETWKFTPSFVHVTTSSSSPCGALGINEELPGITTSSYSLDFIP
jgi:hypothetical protein